MDGDHHNRTKVKWVKEKCKEFWAKLAWKNK